MIGRIPMVLKTAIQTNHARWLALEAFHIAMNFHTESQIASIIITEMNHGIKGIN